MQNHSSQMKLQWLAFFICGALCIIVGCATLSGVRRIDGTMTNAYIRVMVQGANTVQDLQNAVNSWHGGNAPQITAEGNNTFLLCWAFTVGAGQVENFGADIKDPTKWKKLGCFNGSGDSVAGGTLTEVVCPPDIELSAITSTDRVVRVTNPSSTLQLRITTLQVALSPQNIPLGSMDYSNPAIEGLNWTTVIGSTTDLAPSEVRVLDIPDAPPTGDQNCYARALYLSTAPGDSPVGSVSKVLSADHIPTVSEWGIVAMVFLLLIAATAVLRTKRTWHVTNVVHN